LNLVEAAAAAVMEAATEVATTRMSAAEAATGQRKRCTRCGGGNGNR
jgi:hypothetical protein